MSDTEQKKDFEKFKKELIKTIKSSISYDELVSDLDLAIKVIKL